jgi:serine/threonine protein kinase
VRRINILILLSVITSGFSIAECTGNGTALSLLAVPGTREANSSSIIPHPASKARQSSSSLGHGWLNPRWIPRVRLVNAVTSNPGQIVILPESLGDRSEMRRIWYRSRQYYAKYADNIADEKRFIVPQAQILHYLHEIYPRIAICRPMHLVEVQTDRGVRKMILFRIINGEALDIKIQRQGRLSQDQALDIILQVAETLERIQQAGVYHWDIKPENIIITKQGRPIIGDFDFAFRTFDEFIQRKLYLTGSYQFASSQRLRWFRSGLQEHAEEFFAPELDELYSLGVTLSIMLAGDKHDMAILNELTARVSPRLLAIIDNAVNGGESQYHTMREFIEALEQCRSPFRREPVLLEVAQ